MGVGAAAGNDKPLTHREFAIWADGHDRLTESQGREVAGALKHVAEIISGVEARFGEVKGSVVEHTDALARLETRVERMEVDAAGTTTRLDDNVSRVDRLPCQSKAAIAMVCGDAGPKQRLQLDLKSRKVQGAVGVTVVAAIYAVFDALGAGIKLIQQLLAAAPK